MTEEQYNKYVSDVAAHFQFQVDKIHNHIHSFKSALKVEVARLMYFEHDQTIGIQFHIEIANTDTIQVYEICKKLLPELRLLQSFYVNAKGEVFNGIDATVMLENDRENKMVQVLAAREKAQQQEAYELRQMEKKGKLTFH